MSLIEKLEKLSGKIREYSGQDLDEANTEIFCFEPFIELLGFKRNPTDMQRQYPADMRGKSEKVDYAMKKDGVPIMIVECKRLGADLDAEVKQLGDYFTAVRESRFGILTDGRLYRFYTDLDDQNLMDSDPFLEIDLFDIQPRLVTELERFTKPHFNVNQALAAARDLKYSKAIHQFLMKQLESPDEDFVRYVASAIDFPIDTPEQEQQIAEIIGRVLKEFKGEVTDPLPPPVPPVGPDEDESWIGKKISGFTFDGKSYKVKKWNEFLVKFCKILSKDDALQLRDVLELEPSRFSENRDSFPPSANSASIKEIGKTGIYVHTGINNDHKREVIEAIVEHFGLPMPKVHMD